MSSIKKHGFQLMRIISDPYTGQPLGELYTVFSSQELLGNQADLLKNQVLMRLSMIVLEIKFFLKKHNLPKKKSGN